MNIRVEGSTKLGYVAPKQEFDELSGLMGGICYMPDTFDTLKCKPQEVKLKRAENIKENKHHSCTQHAQINFVFEGIPKILAMIINNEKIYSASEKSARYTKMVLSSKEQKIYDKWLKIFELLITKKYPAEKYNGKFWGTDEKSQNRIRVKLAQENARYLTNIFTPTTIGYSVSYGQINYIYQFLKQELDLSAGDVLRTKLKPYIEEFLKGLKDTGYIDEKITCDEKKRSLSLFNDKQYAEEEYFGDVYCTSYKASFAELAQAQRHRTLSYSFKMPADFDCYIPPILKDDERLVKAYLDDMQSLEKEIPQGTLLDITEKGTLDNFILKMKERKCTYAQLEINNTTDNTLNKYVDALKAKNHQYAAELEKYTKGSRCTFPDYKCIAPCQFKEGVDGTREI